MRCRRGRTFTAYLRQNDIDLTDRGIKLAAMPGAIKSVDVAMPKRQRRIGVAALPPVNGGVNLRRWQVRSDACRRENISAPEPSRRRGAMS